MPPARSSSRNSRGLDLASAFDATPIASAIHRISQNAARASASLCSQQKGNSFFGSNAGYQTSSVFYVAEAGSPMTFYVLGDSMAITWAIEKAGGIVCRDPPGTSMNEHPASIHAQRIIFNRDITSTKSSSLITSCESSILQAVETRGGWQMILSSDWIFHSLREGRLVDAAPYKIKPTGPTSPASSISTLGREMGAGVDQANEDRTVDETTSLSTSIRNDTESRNTTLPERPLFSSFFDAANASSPHPSTPSKLWPQSALRPIPTGPRSTFDSSTPVSGQAGGGEAPFQSNTSTFGPMRNQNRGNRARQRAGPGYKRPDREQRPFAGNQFMSSPAPFFIPQTPCLDPNVSLAASLLEQSLATLRANSTVFGPPLEAVPLLHRISGLGPNQAAVGGGAMSIADAITLLAKRLAVWTRKLGRRPGKKVLKKYLTHVRIQGCPKSCKNVWIDHRHQVYAEMQNQGINTAQWPLKLN